MLTLYRAEERGLMPVAAADLAQGLPPEAVWIDLVRPSQEEEKAVEHWLGIAIPTREEMSEIEASSRLYDDEGALYMTILAMVNADDPHPGTTDITFILTGGRLVTVRYVEPKPFSRYEQRAAKVGGQCRNADYVLAGLIETFIDRLANVLERAGLDADDTSRTVFEPHGDRPMKTADFRALLSRIGRVGVIASKASESLITIARMLMFLSATSATKLSKETKASVKTAQRDVQQLLDHAAHLTTKTTFLLEATMGLINVEQTNIIKIFSVAAVALLPPTLIASIYGMNFAHMPELDWPWAYPAALGAMVLSAVLPYLYFKRRGWL